VGEAVVPNLDYTDNREGRRGGIDEGKPKELEGMRRGESMSAARYTVGMRG
jgi:hypothetical protein